MLKRLPLYCLALVLLPTLSTAQHIDEIKKDSTGFYVSFNLGKNSVQGSYASSDNQTGIGLNPYDHGYAGNGIASIVNIGFDWCKPKIRLELTNGYNRNSIATNYFLAWYLGVEPSNITSVSTGSYLINTLMLNFDKYFGWPVVSFSLKLGGGFMYWRVPPINADFVYNYSSSPHYPISTSSGSGVMPCLNTGAGLRLKATSHLALLANADYTFGVERPKIEIPYTVTGLPTGQSSYPKSSGNINFIPRSPQYFDLTVGLEFILYHHKTPKATN